MTDILVPLPPASMRRGNEHLRDDSQFLTSARNSVELLREVGLKPSSRVLDFGCGPGRVAIGLIQSGWFDGSYVGVEVVAKQVEWCIAEISSRHPAYRFVYVDAQNDRYNPDGRHERQLPVDDGEVDMFFAFSVFSHMRGNETLAYLREVRRALSEEGRAYITAFVQDDVPPETENPDWFGRQSWSGDLHCVLYSTARIHDLISESGLLVQRVLVPSKNQQTGFVLSKPG